MPPNFQNGKIYSIRSHQTDKIYIGSTTQSLSQRFSNHKSLDCSSREIMKYDDAYIELVEMFPCANKIELQGREGEVIRTTDCVNNQIAGRTRAEYQKQYREDNKEEIKQYSKQYSKDNKESIKQYSEDNKESIKQTKKQYREDNKESIKQYYKDNKESIKQYQQNIKKIRTCSCGGKYNDGNSFNRTRHYSSKHHIEFVNDFYDRLHSLLVPEDSNDEYSN